MAAPTAAPTTTTDNNPTSTQQANAAVAQANPGVFGGSSTPSNTISSTNLAPTTPVQLPPPPSPAPGVAAANGMVAGATAPTTPSVADYTAKPSPPTTALDTQQQSILDSIASLTGEDAQKGQDTADAQAAAG